MHYTLFFPEWEGGAPAYAFAKQQERSASHDGTKGWNLPGGEDLRL